jgi:diguanylate cyclase (GGDEF)-like protein
LEVLVGSFYKKGGRFMEKRISSTGLSPVHRFWQRESHSRRETDKAVNRFAKWVVVETGNWEILSFSDRFAKVMGYSCNDFLSIVRFLKQLFSGGSEEYWTAKIKREARKAKFKVQDMRLVHRDRTWLCFDVEGEKLSVPGQLFLGFEQVTKADIDFLTRLYNFRAFHDWVIHYLRLAQRTKSEISLLYIDVDKFKEINDALGEPIADLLLVKLAEELRNCASQADKVFRHAGDQFIVLALTHIDADVFSLRLNERLKTLGKGSFDFRVSVSGAYYCPKGERGPSLESLRANLWKEATGGKKLAKAKRLKI